VLLEPTGVALNRHAEAAGKLAAACGLFLDDWQQLWLDVAMGERADETWAATTVGCIASRQNGKNGTVEARELYGLTVLDEQIIHTSHVFGTTRDSYARLLAYIQANPEVEETLVSHVASPASGYQMRFRGGGRISFIARSRTSGRGLTGDLLIFDEAQDLNDAMQEALLPTISSRPGSQAWYFGSAPGGASETFHRIRARGRAGEEERMAYLEWSADPEADLDDRDAWAQANPAMNVRAVSINEEIIESERAEMSDEGFARERLSISPDLFDGANIIPAADWSACADENSGLVGKTVYALDVSPSRDTASVVAAGDALIVLTAAGGAGRLGWFRSSRRSKPNTAASLRWRKVPRLLRCWSTSKLKVLRFWW
jgi:phage terminase large subunit-like protein